MEKEELTKSDGAEKSLWREVLSWIISASSVVWLLFIWNIYVKTPSDKQTFITTVLIYLPIWIGYITLKNRGERYQRLRQIVSTIAILPPVLLYFGYYFINPKSAFLGSFQLILFTACFGLIWEVGRQVKEFRIVLFKD